MSRLVVAAAQMALRPGDVPANLEAHRRVLAGAREAGVDLLVFPELSLTGYASEPDLGRLARGPDCAELRTIAAEAGPGTVLVGFIERGADGRARNACAVLEGGRIAHLQRKLCLPTYGALVEGRHYAPGERVEIAATRAGRLATLICADLWNPALPWLAALAGAELIAAPIASARGAVADEFDSREGWDVVLRHTALLYGLPVIMANGCGRGELAFWGGSVIYDAFGRAVARAGEEPCLLVAKIDLADGRRARERLPTVRDASPETVASELARFLGLREEAPAARAIRRAMS